jgi:hypothetical protein
MAHTPNPRRVEAGRRNHAKRKGFTPEERERHRQVALEHQPWRHSTGPRTPEGKDRIRASNVARRKGTLSVAAIRAELAQYRSLLDAMHEVRALILD